MATKTKPSKAVTKKAVKKVVKKSVRLYNPITRPAVLRAEGGGSVIGYKYADGKTVVAKATKKIKTTSKKARKMAKESRRKNRGK